MPRNSIRMIGAEFKRFYADPEIWPEGSYHDDILILVDGVDANEHNIDLNGVSDQSVIEIRCGTILDGAPGVPEDMLEAAALWQGKQSSQSFAFSVPNEKVEAFKAAMLALGIALEG